jgi:hypothetical protein
MVMEMARANDLLIMPSVKVERKPPENLRPEDREIFEDAFEYRTNDTRLTSLGAAWVSPDSVVYKNGILQSETVVTHDQRSYYRFKHLAKKILKGKSIRLSTNKKYLLVTDAWSSGHFHWFTETLPKLWIIRNQTKEFTLLLPDTPYIKRIALESMKLLGVTFEDFVFMRDSEFYRVPNLYYVSRIAKSGQMHDAIMQELNRAFAGGNPGGQKRIYISREKAKFRKILNEAELTALLKDFGFEILYGEDYDLTAQIEIFSHCSTLMGIHGAGLTNCIFMKRGGSVIELGKREKNYGYWHLAEAIEHRYRYYYGDSDSNASLIGAGCNLSIRLDDFKNSILMKE